jgi:leader peptidase (prepilin peptidase)/N-methyltransferase
LPIFSWIFLKGQCRNCDQPIGIAYLIYEISPIVIAIWVITYLPHEIRWVGCMLGWSLFCLAAMDYKYFTLPNVITIPLLFSGILFSIYWDSTPVIDHLLGAIVGYGVLYTISAAYYTLRKREGLGQGDVKLFAAVGAWVSLSGLSSVLLFACVTALLGIGVKVLSGQPLDREEKIPFGAHLCFAAWIVWLYGPLSAVP